MTELIWTLVVAITILVPGAVIRRFQAQFLTIPDPKHEKEALLLLVLYGLANLALTWPLLLVIGVDPLTPLFLANNMQELVVALRSHHALVWLAQLFVAPVFLAVARAYLERSGIISRALSRAGLTPVRSSPHAWDAAFALHRRDDRLVSVTLKNGTVLHGRYGSDAMAGVRAADGDLYLDEVYIPAESGCLELCEESRGILISGTEVSYLVFSEMPNDEDEEAEEE